MKRPTRRARDHRRRRGNPPRRRAFLAVLVGTALGSPLLTRAQEKAKRVIGFLIGSSLPPPTKTAFGAAFHSGLEAIGYVEGENLTVEYRASAEELIADNVEVIIVASGGSIRQVQRATQSIPIVFILFDLPLSAGFVASFSRPGGNITGVSMLMSGLMPKRLQLLHELVPKARSCAVLVNPRNAGVEGSTRSGPQEVADGMGLALEIVSARSPSDLEAAFDKMMTLKAAALLVAPDPLFMAWRGRLVAHAARYAIPDSYFFREFVLAGGLISYGPQLTWAYRQAGLYVGKILGGQNPADLPVIQPTIFEMVLNLKTANQLGLTVPQTILGRADEVIE